MTRRIPFSAALFALTLIASSVAPVFAAEAVDVEVPSASPETLGLSTERLARITEVMNQAVEDGRMAGGIGLIARRGKVAYFETYGHQDREGELAMEKDAIFRIYSMSKAVTGVAVAILYEEHGFPLSTPVKRWLPELDDMKVAVDRMDPDTGERLFRLEPARRDITVRDLLTHTAGISYGGPKDARGKSFYQEAGVREPGIDLEEFTKRLGTAPLHNHPGTVWQYGLSMDVLGRLVEVISGQTFDVFLEERIFAPLGMVDTAFFVPAGKEDRLTVLYSPADEGAVKRSSAPPQTSYLTKPSIFYGGAGLVSTTKDYFRLTQMLLNYGELDGVRILGRKTVELLSADHIGALPRVGNLIAPHDGFGLTFRVNTSPGLSGALGSAGEYSWGGAAGTRFWIDPEEEMVTLFMVQILPHTGITLGTEFKNLAYQAIVDVKEPRGGYHGIP